MWPHPENPHYGVFVQRQVESLVEAGVAADVMFVRGYLGPSAYVRAGLMLLWRSIVSRKRYQLIHAHGGETAIAARLYLTAPLLVSYCGSDLLGASVDRRTATLKARVVSATLRQYARFARATITKSKHMEDCLPRSRRSANAVIPNGVNDRLFVPQERSVARHKLGWDLDRPVVLFVGNPNVKCKRYPLAQSVCQLAAQKIPALSLRLVSGVAPDSIPDYLNAADCLLLSSSSEGSPNVVKEALMCNLPVVSTRVGDVEELLANVHPSYVCDDSEEALAAALSSCVESRSRSNGRSVSSHLTASEIADRILKLYESLAPGLAGVSSGLG